jgi:hypothetical protein
MSDIETVVIVTGTHIEKIRASQYNPAIHTLHNPEPEPAAPEPAPAEASAPFGKPRRRNHTPEE